MNAQVDALKVAVSIPWELSPRKHDGLRSGTAADPGSLTIRPPRKLALSTPAITPPKPITGGTS